MRTVLAVLVVAAGVAALDARVAVSGDVARSAWKPAPWSAGRTVRLVTFNVQDTWVVGTHRPQRMRRLGQLLTALDPDVVALQEAFIAADQAVLQESLGGSRLVNRVVYPSGCVGSGLTVLSAFPVAEAWFHRFSVSNPWYRLGEADWWAGKGVALARLDLPGGGGLDVFNLHTQADYGQRARYPGVRAQQLREAVEFVRAAGTVPALVAGDFNAGLDAPELRALPWQRVLGVDSALDHVFHVPDGHHRVEVLRTQVLEERWVEAGEPLELSDHPGYLVELRITP